MKYPCRSIHVPIPFTRFKAFTTLATIAPRAGQLCGPAPEPGLLHRINVVQLAMVVQPPVFAPFDPKAGCGEIMG